MLCLAQYDNCNNVSIYKVLSRNEEREDGSSLLEGEFEIGSKEGFYEAIMETISGIGIACTKAQVYGKHKEWSYC